MYFLHDEFAKSMEVYSCQQPCGLNRDGVVFLSRILYISEFGQVSSKFLYVLVVFNLIYVSACCFHVSVDLQMSILQMKLRASAPFIKQL